MKLAELFATMSTLVEGRRTPEDVARAWYGTRADALVPGLEVYARRGGEKRGEEMLDGMYPSVRRAVVALAGKAGWDRVIESYLRAFPPRHYDSFSNAVHLPEHLIESSATLELPAWMAEVADFERWEWKTDVTFDPDVPVPGGRLRLAPSVELRAYEHDIVAWIDDAAEDGALAPAPEANPIVVVFWRDGDHEACRNGLTGPQLLVLEKIRGGELTALAADEADSLASLCDADIVLATA